jgi:prepilin-type N-terminal cleavage/methylation domain-containing protein
MLRRTPSAGFTLVEVVVALTLLSVAVLGLASSAARLATSTASAEVRALAVEAVEDQLSRVRLDPRYGGLDTLYTGVDHDLFGVPGLTRTTRVVHVQQSSPHTVDYKRITVTVAGVMVSPAISRVLVVAAP